jgi:hypothetical protein
MNLFDNPKRMLIKEGPVKIDDRKGFMFAFNDLLVVADRSASSLKYLKRLTIGKDSRIRPDLKGKIRFFFELLNFNFKNVFSNIDKLFR